MSTNQLPPVSIALLFTVLAFSAHSQPIQLSNHPQLFLDDHLVAKMTNVQRELQQPVKHAPTR